MTALSAQTKILLIAFSSVVVLVLIGSAIYKGWYFNTFSTSTQEPLTLFQDNQTESFTIKMVPSSSTAAVGESITYSLIPNQTLEASALGVRLLIASEYANQLDLPESFTTAELEQDNQAILNTITENEQNQVYADLAIISVNPRQNPVLITANQSIASFAIIIPDVDFDPATIFSLDQESSMITFLEDNSASIELEIEPVTITE
ncbi:MAG: hypothetical protein WDZ94_05810 [Patescibacteria group bacterium]